MYSRAEKQNENKSRAVANAVGQTKSSVKHGLGIVDNRQEAVYKRSTQPGITGHPFQNKGVIQRSREKDIQSGTMHAYPLQGRPGAEFVPACESCSGTSVNTKTAQLIFVNNLPYGMHRQRNAPVQRQNLWNMVERELGKRYYSTHGCKGRFLEWVKGPQRFANLPSAAVGFVQYAIQQGWAKPFKLHRPNWPDDISEQSEKGEDIRHIVRNATIKNALLQELNHSSDPDMASDMMNMLADDIGIKGLLGRPAPFIMKAVYNKLYLNKGNLWSGPGAINRAIGLMADPLMALGLAYKNEPAIQLSTMQVNGYFNDILNTARGKLEIVRKNGMKLNKSTQATFFKGYDEWKKTFFGYLHDAQIQLGKEAGFGMVSAYQIGSKLYQVGANLGFDTPGVHPRIKDLIRVEQFLAGYKGNDPDGLSDCLKLFMQVGGGLN